MAELFGMRSDSLWDEVIDTVGVDDGLDLAANGRAQVAKVQVMRRAVCALGHTGMLGGLMPRVRLRNSRRFLRFLRMHKKKYA